MVTIEVIASIKGHVITWLYDGDDENQAVQNAKKDVTKKGLFFVDYILA